MLHVRDTTAQSALSIRHLVANVNKQGVNGAISDAVRLPSDALRYLVNTLVRALMRADRDPWKVTLLESIIEHAVTQLEFVTLLCDMFENVPSVSVEVLMDFIQKQLKLSAKAQLAVAIAICSATGDTATHGRRVLARLTDEASADAAAAVRKWGAPAHVLVALLTVSRSDANLVAAGRALAAELNTPFPLPRPITVGETASMLSKSISLARVISELGPTCVGAEEDASALMALMPDTITPLAVAQSISYFATPSMIGSSDAAAFNLLKTGFDVRGKGSGTSSPQLVLTLAQAVKAKYPTLDWNNVIAALDNPRCTAERFSAIPSAYKKATGQMLPLRLFLGQWGNRALQGTALRFALTNPELMNRELPSSAVFPSSDVALWSNVQFVEAIVNASIADKECAVEITKAMKAHPTTLMAGLLTMSPAIGMRNLHYAEQLIALVGTSLITQNLLVYLRQTKRIELFVSVLGTVASQGDARVAADSASAEAAGVPTKRTIEIVEAFINYKLVDLVVANSTSPKVIVYTAILATGTGLLPTLFLADRLSESNTLSAVHPCNRFAVAQAIVEVADELMGKEQYMQAVSSALSAFQSASSIVSILPALAAQAKALQAGASGLADAVSFPEDVEKTAKEFLDHTYRLQQMSSTEVVDQLELWKKSPKPRDQQVFDCIVQILFEETRSLSDYPFRALLNAAVLFGQIIARNLLDSSKMQLALKIILQMLVKPTDLKVGEYGITALEQLKSRLSDHPAFAKQLKEIPDLDFRIPGIMSICSSILDGGRRVMDPACLPINKNMIVAASNAAAGPGSTGLHQHDIRVLVEENTAAPPPQVIQERINFLVGNTDPSNIEVNSAELATLLTPEFYQYFAEYLVVKRISLEPNYHKMYLQLVERLQAPELERRIRSATIIAVKRLLASDKIRTNSSERSLLKNLGSWLGNFTLARDKPVYARHLDFKELIYLGLETGRLIAIVPFIAKVLDGAVNSRVFRPQNPWLMATLVTLMEMYNLPDLKLTLRFEVEVLCKNLGLSVHDVIDYSKYHPRPPRVPSMADIRASMRDIADSTDFRSDDSSHQQHHHQHQQQQQQQQQQGPPDDPAIIQAGAMSSPASLAGKRKLQADAVPYQPRQMAVPPLPEITPVVLSLDTVRAGPEANIMPQANRPQYLQVLALALERPLKEVYPHVERSVRIAVTTTRDIIVKDYARDGDNLRMRRSAQLMARSLATNLSTASVSEPLRVLMRKALSNVVQRLAEKEEDQATISDTIIKNNIELLLSAVEYQACELASDLIDKALLPVIEERNQAMARGDFPLIPSDQIHAASSLQLLSEDLFPRGSLSPAHNAVFEHFSTHVNVVEQLDKLFLMIQEATTKHYQLIPPKSQETVLSLTSVSFTEKTHSQAHAVVKQKLVEMSQLINERTAVPFIGVMFPRLMTIHEQQQRLDPRALTTEICVLALLSEVCLFVLQTAREKGQNKAVEALTKLYLAHERRWTNREIATNFIRLSIIDIAEFDTALCRALRDETAAHHRQIVEFAGHIVQRCLIDDKLTTPKDLKLTLATLEEIAASSKRSTAQGGGRSAATPPAQARTEPIPSRVRLVSLFPHEMRQEVEALFAEWIAICSKRPGSEDAGAEGSVATQQQSAKQLAMGYVSKLQQANKLKADGTLDSFIGLVLELSVEEYASVAERTERAKLAEPGSRPQDPPQQRLPSSNALLAHVDAFSDLMFLLIRCCSWSAPQQAQAQAASPAANPEMALIQKILNVVTKVIMNNHDTVMQGTPLPPAVAASLPEGHVVQKFFLQQPYVRFHSNMILSLLTGDAQTDESMFVTMALHSLRALSPNRLPGFAFGWLELLCHRVLVAKALKSRVHWPLYFRLLADALRLIDSATRNGEISNSMLLFFKSILKLMLVLLHDFSDFLLTYHQPLCEVIPSSCVQLRNVVLAAFPRSVKLPDPFQETLRVDQLPEVSNAPPVADISKEPFEGAPFTPEDIAAFCRTRQPATFPGLVIEAVLKGTPDKTRAINVPLLNATILFLGIATLEASGNRVPERLQETPMFEMLVSMARGFHNEARYMLISACANHLRFPNSHTHLFLNVILTMFDFSSYGTAVLQELVQEQITRTIVERLIISRPHPWGLLVTFIQLARDPAHKLWDRPFIRCTPEIERVFASVGKTINGPAATAPSTSPAAGAPAAAAAAAAPPAAAVAAAAHGGAIGAVSDAATQQQPR